MTVIALLWRYRVSLAVGAIIAAALVWHRAEVSSASRQGWSAARAELEAANRAAAEKADEAARTLAECPLDRWSRETGQCVK
jgi:hypothetical protein